MAEPQPPLSSTAVVAATEDVEVPAPAPASAEDRKAAAALSSLDAPAEDASKSQADSKALGEAMSRLELLEKGGAKVGTAGGAGAAAKAEKEKKEEVKKKIKVDAGDVAVLVEHLELSRAKATELLKSHDGSAEKALTAYITASA